MARISEQQRQRIERAVMRHVRQRGKKPDLITAGDSELDTQIPTTGQLSEFMRITVPRNHAYVVPDGAPVKMFIPVEDEFTSNGTAGDDEQFSLTQNVVNSPNAADADTSQTAGGAEVAATGRADIVLWDANTQQAMSAVDIANDTVNYSDAGTGNSIEVYYLWAETSQIEAQHWDQAETRRFGRSVFTTDVRALHDVDSSDKDRVPRFQTNEVLLEKEHFIWKINTSVDLTGWDDAEAFPYIRIPMIPVSLSRVEMSVPQSTPAGSRARGRGSPLG